jgi:hypothetical protein
MPRCTARTQPPSSRRCKLPACAAGGAAGLCGVHVRCPPAPPAPAPAADPSPDSCCAICLDDIAPRQPRLALRPSCPHAFHRACLLGWFDRNQLTCPTCRAEVPADVFHRAYARARAHPFDARGHYLIAHVKQTLGKLGFDPARCIDETGMWETLQRARAMHGCRPAMLDLFLAEVEVRMGEFLERAERVRAVREAAGVGLPV